jgi:hypothetical protein
MPRGFHRPGTQRHVAEGTELPGGPKKGKRSRERLAQEHSPRFVRLYHRRSVVESAISALEEYRLGDSPIMAPAASSATTHSAIGSQPTTVSVSS